MIGNTSSLDPDRSPHSTRDQLPAVRIFDRLMQGYAGSASLRLWNNMLHAPGDQSPSFTLEFESGGTGIYQVLASRRNRGEWPVPLSRRDLYVGCDGRSAGVN